MIADPTLSKYVLNTGITLIQARLTYLSFGCFTELSSLIDYLGLRKKDPKENEEKKEVKKDKYFINMLLSTLFNFLSCIFTTLIFFLSQKCFYASKNATFFIDKSASFFWFCSAAQWAHIRHLQNRDLRSKYHLKDEKNAMDKIREEIFNNRMDILSCVCEMILAANSFGVDTYLLGRQLKNAFICLVGMLSAGISIIGF